MKNKVYKYVFHAFIKSYTLKMSRFWCFLMQGLFIKPSLAWNLADIKLAIVLLSLSSAWKFDKSNNKQTNNQNKKPC